MSMTALLFGFAMIDNILLLLINIYNIITLSDLETDLMNVRQCCTKLNQTFLPEIALHVMLTVFFIFSHHWLLFLLNVCLDLWFAYVYFKRQPGQLGIYDPLEINNRQRIKAKMRMFILHGRYFVRRHIHLFKQCYSTSTIKALNVAFFGSDLFSMHILEHLYQLFTSDKSRIKCLEVVTTVSTLNTVMQGAEKLQLTTHVWPNIDSLISKSPVQFDVGILASFGQLLPKRLIESFPLGIINVHPSLLPRWRGSSPLIYTIASGDKTSGVSIMDIRPKHFDIGPVLMQQSFPLSTNMTMFELLKISADVGCSLLDKVLEDPIKSRENAQEQVLSGITYAHKINKYGYFIDWHNHTTEDIDRLYRALNQIANLRTIFRQKPVRLKLLTLINDQNILNDLNAISSQPGTAIYNKSLECICIRCKNGWIGFKKLAYLKSMYARDFHNGYISKMDRFVFDSIHNSLFDYIYERRVPK
ncbi:unnamed protein product [Adineta steineri]|uniref:methionyl-tRNA formyltransferase n=1 Tax=Adineta steineri TaxID=433720 RepID=A0A815IV48_9BILA|nr:unnamed protein product [Adineta steineri]